MSIVTALGKERIEANLKATAPTRKLLNAGGKACEHELARAFAAVADVGEWNREHPSDRIEPTP